MSDMNMYNILGRLNSLTPDTPAASSPAKKETIYESVEPRGSLSEAIRSLESKYDTFKEEREYDDSDAYDKCDPKHPDFKKNYDEFKAKNPKSTVADFIAHMKGNKVKEGREFKNKDEFDSSAKPGDTYKTAKGTVTKTAKGVKHERRAGKEEEKDELDESYTGRETKDGVWRVFKSGKAVAEAGPFKSAKEANAWISKQKKAVKESDVSYSAKKLRANESFEDKLELAREKAAAKGLTKDKTKGSEPNVRLVKGQQYGGSKQKDVEDKDDLDEVAPPGAKAERTVKHIKKGYASDGKLTKREKGIAYATAWKAHNKGQVEEGTEFKDTIKNSQAKLTKAPKAKLKESADLRKHPIYTTQEAWDHYAKELAEQQTMEDMSQSNIPSPTNANPITSPNTELDEIARLAGLPAKDTGMEEDMISGALGGVAGAVVGKSPTAAATGAKIGSGIGDMVNEGPSSTFNGKDLNVNSIELDGVDPADHPDYVDAYIVYAEYADGTPLTDDELDQLTDERGDLVNQAAHGNLADHGDYLRDLDEDDDVKLPPPPPSDIGKYGLEEENMGEGNEFSGALARAKAEGAKEFEVDGKRYTVKEDVTLMADGDDVVNLIRKLAGMDTVEPEMAPTSAIVSAEPVDELPGMLDAEEVDEERSIEYINTPREKTAGLEAAIPSGNDLHRAKKSYSDKPYRGDNPMAVKEEALWKAYESMISSVKK